MLCPVRRLPTLRHEPRVGWIAASVCAVGLFAAACNSEEPTAIDFSAPSDDTGTTLPAHSDGQPIDDDANDPNAAQRSMVFGLAEQQCLDDPELEQGIIQIAVPDTGEVVNEVSVECGEVRERAEAGEPAGVELIPESLRPETG